MFQWGYSCVFRTDYQLEQFFLCFLQGEYGDAATIESRRQIRDEFVTILLESIVKVCNNTRLQSIIQYVNCRSVEFTECVISLLSNSRHKLPTLIDCKHKMAFIKILRF